MSSTSSSETATPAIDSHAPLLRSRQPDAPAARPSTLALLLGRVTGRRGASMLVRETAARELEERRADWGYSKPVVALDMLWNTAFVVVSVVMLICTVDERPNTPIRLWICGYALQCLVHVVLVWLEYRRRNTRRTSARDEERGDTAAAADANDSEDELDGTEGSPFDSNEPSVTKRCETVNTMASFVWWIVGFYWVVFGGDILLRNAPRLYWYAFNQPCHLTSNLFVSFDIFVSLVAYIDLDLMETINLYTRFLPPFTKLLKNCTGVII